MAGFLSGVLGISAADSLISLLPTGDVPAIENDQRSVVYVLGGLSESGYENGDPELGEAAVAGQVLAPQKQIKRSTVVRIQRLRKRK
jgi:hypothetical protein